MLFKDKFDVVNHEHLLSRINKQMGLFWVVLLISSFLSGCAPVGKITRPMGEITRPMLDSHPRKLVVFFDGTANDESSDTNIHKLHELVKNQSKAEDVSTFYIEGVGANWKIIGDMTGWGIGYRVRRAYEYLTENYRKGDKIYLFGFSRGAYSARILASMLYHAGLPESPIQAGELNAEYATSIFDAFKGDMTREERKKAVKEIVKSKGLHKLKSTDVEFLGLWDTVEALGKPNYEEDVILPNSRYGDQLCNVHRAAHALALDDDRARIFTPILLTRPHLLEHCTIGEDNAPWSLSPEDLASHLNDIVDEVWFTGAHADVGGGYGKDDKGLSAVSLNWMIAKLINEGLLPTETPMEAANPDGKVHDPEAGLWGTIYRQKWRSFMEYTNKSPYNHGKLKIHASVIKRLKKPEQLACASCQSRNSQWRLPELFPYCFPINDSGGYDFTKVTSCQLEEVPSLPTK